MDGATELLVVILSIFLAVFLVLGIILTVILIRLTRTVKNIADKAEGAVNNVQAAANIFKNAAGPMAVGRVIKTVADIFKKRRGK